MVNQFYCHSHGGSLLLSDNIQVMWDQCSVIVASAVNIDGQRRSHWVMSVRVVV